MDDNEFKQFVVEKLLSIENRLTRLEEGRKWERRLVKALTIIVGAILMKMGVSVTV